MKKYLGMALAMALVMPSGFASAEVLKNLKVGGALDFQANSVRNLADFSNIAYDRVGDAVTRVMLNTSWDLTDDIHANVSLVKNDRAWGTKGGGGQIGGGQAQAITADGNNVLGSVYVQQANVKIDKFAGQVDATLGRQYFGETGDLVIYYGPKNVYGLYVTAIDAFRVDWANDMIGFSGLAGKTTGNAIGAATGNDVDVRGFDLSVKNLPVKVTASLWNQVTHRVAGTTYQPNDHLYVYSLKAKAEAMGANVGAQFAGNFGENRTATAARLYRGWAFLADAGYKADVSGIAAFSPWLQFGYGTGDQGQSPKNHGFTAIASDFRPGIINGRFNASGNRSINDAVAANAASTVGLNNRVIYGAGLKVTPAAAEKLVVGLGLWDYSLQTITQVQANGEAYNKHLGYEYGLTLDWNHSENVKYGVGAARFMPGRRTNGLNAGTTSAPVSLMFADLSLKF
ncbi:MAG: hypothetical protein WCU88_04250 [Elusimicrobiota bacterium]|jgi:hypothetical protein